MTASRIALVGDAFDAGEQIVRALIERGFSADELRLLASAAREGEALVVDGARLSAGRADSLGLSGVDAVVFFGDGGLAADLIDFVPRDVICLDATSHASGRTDSVPIVAEINSELIGALAASGPLVLPAPATVGLAVALAPLHEVARVRRVVTTMFMPASAAGAEGVEQLARQTVELLQGRGFEGEAGPEHRAFNMRPQSADDSGWSVDEKQIAFEIGAIFGEPRIEVVATAVSVSVFYGIGHSVYVETEEPVDVATATRLFMQGRGLLLGQGAIETLADPCAEAESQGASLAPGLGPVEIAGSDAVHVGRLRADPLRENSLAFWLCFDDQRKGTALSIVAALEVALRDARG